MTNKEKLKLALDIFLATLIALTSLIVIDKMMEVPEAQAEMMWFHGGELEFDLTTDKGYVKHELWKAGLLEDWEFVERLITAESNWDVWAIGQNPNPTIDRGLWQINSYWHSEVSNECAFDLECSTKEAIRIRLADGNFNQWLAIKQ